MAIGGVEEKGGYDKMYFFLQPYTATSAHPPPLLYCQ